MHSERFSESEQLLRQQPVQHGRRRRKHRLPSGLSEDRIPHEDHRRKD